ncbi:MAG: hypothetical protein P8P83_00090 [Rickettsiaceae bacterium]|nr:hypothetical protein [Rickettsiaceae bacterium]
MVKLLLAHGAEDANPFWVFIALSNGNTETVKAMTSAAFADNLVEKKKDLNLKSIDEIDFKVFLSRLEYKLGQDFKDHINIICSQVLNELGDESDYLPPLDLLINQKELQNFSSETSDNVKSLINYYIDSIEKHFSPEEFSKFSDDIKYLFEINAAAEQREEALTPARIQELKEMVYQTNLKILESQIGSADNDLVGMIIQQLFPQEFAQAEERGIMRLEDHNVALQDIDLAVEGAAAEDLDLTGQAEHIGCQCIVS